MPRTLVLLVLLISVVLPMPAQTGSGNGDLNFELFAGYSANGYFVDESSVSAVNQDVSSFNDRAGGPRGFELSLSRNLKRYISLKGDFSTYFETLNGRTGTVCQSGACTTGQAFRVPLHSLYFMAGPEFKLQNHTRVVPLAYALFGAVYSHASFTIPTSSFSDSSAQTGFASAFGGGFDFSVTRRFGLRTTLDYSPTFLHEATPGESGPQHHIRISVGGVFHF